VVEKLSAARCIIYHPVNQWDKIDCKLPVPFPLFFFFFLFLSFSLSKWIVVILIMDHINWQDISQSLRASGVKFDHLPGLPSSRSTKGKTTADR
jgi:hypothetical protein